MDANNFDTYVLEDGQPEAEEVRVIEKGTFAGAGVFPRPTYLDFVIILAQIGAKPLSILGLSIGQR